MARLVEQQVEKAMLNTASGPRTLPAGSVTYDAQTARAMAGSNAGTEVLTTPLPVDPRNAVTSFGPGTPFAIRPLDQVMPWGRPEPRRSQYEIAWNLMLGGRMALWQTLEDVADNCDVVRRCIDIRKGAIQEKDWDIALTDWAVAEIMEARGERNAARAESLGRKQFEPKIREIREFLQEPDRQNHLDWTEWLGNFLEEHFVFDAPTVYPVRTLGGGLHSLRIVDGSTIKPLRDVYGNIPQPPFPAYQQVLYGFPRGEFTASEEPDGEYSADELFYRPRDRRSRRVYGTSPTEKALPAALLWMLRQEWLKKEYTHGTLPASFVEADLSMQPADRTQWEESFNLRMEGDSAARQQIKVLPGGFKNPVFVPQIGEKYTANYDEFLIKQIGSRFAVMPTQLGIIPQGTGGMLGYGRQPGEQDISETLGDGPLEEWLVDVLNVILRRYLGMPKELTFAFTGGGIDEDAQTRAQTNQIMLFSGQKTENDIRAENGDTLYDFPEANMPFVNTATGPEYLAGSSAPEPAPTGGSQIEGAPTHREVASEVAKFETFTKKHQGPQWRDFRFEVVRPSFAKALNSAGARGDIEAVKVLAATVLKALAAEPPQTVRADGIAERITNAVAAALGAGWSGADLLAAIIALEPRIETAPTQENVTHALNTLGFEVAEQTALADVLTAPVDEAFSAGWEYAAQQRGAAPGLYDPEDALRLGALQSTLDRLHIELKGVSQTSVERIGDVLADAIAEGQPSSSAAREMEDVLHDPVRAQTIARTEIARAMEGALLAQAKAMGGVDKRWLDAPGACPVCQANTAEGVIPLDKPFEGGADAPPQHPMCRCALAIVPAPIPAFA